MITYSLWKSVAAFVVEVVVITVQGIAALVLLVDVTSGAPTADASGLVFSRDGVANKENCPANIKRENRKEG